MRAPTPALALLTHFNLKRESFRLLPFWSNHGLSEALEANQSELLTRADALIDGLEMLLPRETPAQQKLVREAVQHVQKAIMLSHGALVLEGERS